MHASQTGSARVPPLPAATRSRKKAIRPRLLSFLRRLAVASLCGALALGLTQQYYHHIIGVGAGAAADESTGEDPSGMDGGIPRGDSTAAWLARHRPHWGLRGDSAAVGGPHAWSYRPLTPGATAVNETVLNPQLAMAPPHNSPRHADSSAAGLEKDRRVAEARRSTPPLRRYYLDGVAPGRKYMLVLSYLGSPSAAYSVALYHVRRSSIRAAHGRQEGRSRGGGEGPAFAPMDTEVVLFAMSRHVARHFSSEEPIVFDLSDLQPQQRQQQEAGGEGDGELFETVIEVTPRVSAFAVDPRDFPVLSYNLDLNPLQHNAIPDMAIPLICAVSILGLGLGFGILYPLILGIVVSSTEGDAAGVELAPKRD